MFTSIATKICTKRCRIVKEETGLSMNLKMYRNIPLTNLVLETDSPFLTPVPFRGNINEPKNVSVIAEFLASIRGEELDELSKLTTLNAKSLFRLN